MLVDEMTLITREETRRRDLGGGWECPLTEDGGSFTGVVCGFEHSSNGCFVLFASELDIHELAQVVRAWNELRSCGSLD